jgi:hypothetical protein
MDATAVDTVVDNALKGQWADVEAAVRQGFPVNALRSLNGLTLLHCAVIRRHNPTVGSCWQCTSARNPRWPT